MANEFLKPEVISAAALGLLERELVLPSLIFRTAEADFRGAKNDTVTLRVPAYLEAREYEFRNDRAQPIVIDDIQEYGVDVKLDKMAYHAAALTDEQLTLDIRDFGEQVLQPQVRAVARKLEQTVADAIEAAPIAWTVTESDPFLAFAKARAALNKAAVPMDGRYMLMGSDTEVAILSSPLLVRVDTSGSPAALRDAMIGRIAGFDAYISQFIAHDACYAIHNTAFAMANFAPVVPDGATFGNSQAFGGYAMRWLRDYDAMYLRDRSIVSSLVGVNSVNDGKQVTQAIPDLGNQDDKNVRAVKVEGIGSGS